MAFSNRGPQPTTDSLLIRQIEAANLFLDSNRECMRILIKGKDTTSPSEEDMEALESAIQLARRAIDLVPDAPDAFYYSTLARGLETRFIFDRTPVDIDKAVQLRKLAVNTGSNNVQHQAEHLHHLAEALSQRYSMQYKLPDIEEAIELNKQAIDMAPDSSDRARYLDHLANCLAHRYSMTRKNCYIEKAILAEKEAINIATDDLTRAHYLIELSGRFGVEYHNSMSDINENILLAKQAFNLIPEGDGRFKASIALANRLDDRFRLLGDIDDIEQAILLVGNTLETRGYNPDKVECFYTMAQLLFNKYVRTEQDPDLDRGIRLAQKAVDEMPASKPQTNYLLTLARGLSLKFSKSGLIQHGENGIQAARRALEATPKNHPKWTDVVAIYAEHLIDRFGSTRAVCDIDEAMICMEKAVNTLPEAHPKWPSHLTSLANKFHIRYLATNKKADLMEGIRLGRVAVDLTFDNYPLRAQRFQILADMIYSQYKTTRDLVNLDEAIILSRKAVEETPEDEVNWKVFSSSLATNLHHRYAVKRDISDLNEAIRLLEREIMRKANEDPHFAASATSLALCFCDRFQQKRASDDIEKAVAYCQSAVRHAHSNAVYRILAARALVLIHLGCTRLDPDQLYQDCELAVNLIPRLVSRSLESPDKQAILTNAVELASNAAMVALEAGKDPMVAVDLLERGRGVMATSLEETRTDISSLRESYPEIADRFVQLQRELSIPIAQDSSLFLLQGQDSSWTTRFDRRYGAGKEFDSLVDKVRELPGFDSFLGSPSTSDVKAAAKYGPLAIINANELQCNALLIEVDQVRLLNLPRLKFGEIEERSNNGAFATPTTLEWLWDTVACPVLNALGFDKHLFSTPQPRMWWIPVGALARFPLHAAGYHTRGSFETVLDRVMSSYSSSVRAIIRSRQRQSHISTTSEALLVAMPETIGHTPLQHIVPEIKQVREICESLRLRPVEPSCRKQDVLLHLQRCAVFHFAGHGYANATNPSHSQLYLEDWQEHPLRVSDLMEINLHKQSPFLAYLSACGTGLVKERNFLDESIHLINAYQLAGFRHVIGTLWEVDDESSLEMAKLTYEGIKEGGMSDESVCWGLHTASRALRDDWIKRMRRKGSGFTRSTLQNDQAKAPQTAVEKVTGKIEVRDGWMWGQYIPSMLARMRVTSSTSHDEDEEKPLRNVELVDGYYCAWMETPLWVPYVHFGV